MGIYSVGIESVGIKSVYQIVQSGKTECLASVSRKGLTCEILARHSCPICTDSSHSNHVQGTCITSQDAKLQDTRENLFSLQ